MVTEKVKMGDYCIVKKEPVTDFVIFKPGACTLYVAICSYQVFEMLKL